MKTITTTSASEVSRNILLNLIDHWGLSLAPRVKTMAGKWHSVLIPIGDDHTAEILIDDDALKSLLIMGKEE